MNVRTVTHNKMGVKLAVWMWNCFDALGITAAFIAFINIDGLEKAILFVSSMTFFGYRIYHLHLDGKRKEIENEEKEFDLKEKKNGKK